MDYAGSYKYMNNEQLKRKPLLLSYALVSLPCLGNVLCDPAPRDDNE